MWIALCADDYGQTLPISQAILALAHAKRITAISCMVNQGDWLEQANALKPLQNQVDIGLHLNFTHGSPLSEHYREHIGETFSSLPKLLLQTTCGIFDQSAIQSEIRAQIARFRETTGMAPLFIDGHQHVHQFKGIRDILLQEVCLLREEGLKLWVRLVSPNEPYQLKAFVIRYLAGGRGFAHLLKECSIPHNEHFLGLYDFHTKRSYRSIMQQFLHQASLGTLLMCHPGLPSQEEAKPLQISRPNEYNYLISNDFLADLENFALHLQRPSHHLLQQ